MEKLITPPGSTAAIYARSAMKSDISIEDQLDLCGGYAAQKGWCFKRSYSDNGRSGLGLTGRSGMSDMLAAAKRGEFQVLVITDLDRVARNPADLVMITGRLKALGVTLCTALCGPVTEIAVNIHGLMGELYRKSRAMKRKSRRIDLKKKALQ